MMSGQAHIEMAVRATRLGALDFLEKPLSTEKLLVTVENALKLTRLEAENRDLRARVGKHTLVFAGETMRRVMAQIERVAASESRVCIYGETGTGKELVARTLHEKSSRAAGPFVTLNCAAVPAELIESELFGHEKGSFTGAAQRHTGKFEQAHRGTLFLDEIGDMPAGDAGQAAARARRGRGGAHRRGQAHGRGCARGGRHAPQPGATGRVGRISPRPLSSRGRVSGGAATAAQAPRRPARAGRAFCAPGKRTKRVEACPFTAAAIDALQEYTWPGNIRELRNVVERLLLLAGGEVGAEDVRLALPVTHTGAAKVSEAGQQANGPLAQRVLAFERAQVLGELERHGRQITQTAKALGLERSHLYKKCQQLGIDLKDLPERD